MKIRLKDDFVGLFEFENELYFKSEYGEVYTDKNGETMVKHEAYKIKRYASIAYLFLAEREGFEPSKRY